MVVKHELRCRAIREKSLRQAGVGTCALAWQVGFFFDGMLRNISLDSETHLLTNVARLFRAHPLREQMDLDSSYLYSAVYISGLGTDYVELPAESLHNMMDYHAMLNGLGTSAVDAFCDANKMDWFDTRSKPLKNLIGIKMAKALINNEIHMDKDMTLDALPPQRDEPMSVDMFVSRVDARVDGAKNSFKKKFTDVNSRNQLPIKLIQVSVFGADLGGMLARRFIEELLEEVCTQEGDEYRYRGAQVEVTFAGLFDCSRRSSFDANDNIACLADPIPEPLEWIGGGKVIDFGKPLHPAVKKALHLVAAHERRVYRPSVLLGPLKPEWHEVLLPGSSEDIIGGLRPMLQRPSAELSRVALHQMYNAARRGEVPFPNMTALPTVNTMIASYFVMYDSVAGKSARFYSRKYMEIKNRSEPSYKSFESHQEIYVWWLGRQYADYHAHMVNATSQERTWLKATWGWLEYVCDEARFVEWAAREPNGYVAYIKGSNALEMAKTFLYPPQKDFPEEIDIFFSYFMHDFVGFTAFTRSPFKEVAVTKRSEIIVGSHDFFVRRGIEALSDNVESVIQSQQEMAGLVMNKGAPQVSLPSDIICTLSISTKEKDIYAISPVDGVTPSRIPQGILDYVVLADNPLEILCFEFSALFKNNDLFWRFNGRVPCGHTSLTYISNWRDFVVNDITQPKGEPSLAPKPVLLAGELIFSNSGRLLWWTNNSGHLQPTRSDCFYNRFGHVKKMLPWNKFRNCFDN